MRNILSDKEKHAGKSLLDVLLTHTYFSVATHLHSGPFPPPDSSLIQKKMLDFSLATYLDKALQKNRIEESFQELQPKHTEYRLLQRSLANSIEILDKNIEIVIPHFENDSAGCIDRTIDLLAEWELLDSASIKNKMRIREALKKFQRMHALAEDGKIGPDTWEALNIPHRKRFKHAAAALENWRHENLWGQDYIYVNIPSYTAKVVKNQAVIRTHRIIIGNPLAQTPPVINSEIKYIITYPHWHVPKGIAVKELLPEIQKDTAYLSKKHYELFDMDQNPVDAENINWQKINPANFRYRIRQKGGAYNALGLIKFIFPNRHYIYLHDTPNQELFKKSSRPFSHGCLRLKDPMEFADYLLKNDSNFYTYDSIQSMISRKERKVISLKNPYPIFVRYVLCGTDEENNLIFYHDIYDKAGAFIRNFDSLINKPL